MNIYSIYKITNKVNGKSYIGFTSKTVEERFEGHIRESKGNSNLHLYQAIRKYSQENFIIETIYESLDADHTLNIMEPYFINEYNTFFGEGYNMSEGGRAPPSRKGCQISEETKKKLSLINAGKNNPFYGKHHTEEAKQKNREAHIGNPCSEETKKKLSLINTGTNHPNYGKKRSEQTKKKIRLTKIGSKHTEETKQKMKGRIPWNKGLVGENNPMFGIPRSEEVKKKIGLANTGKNHSEETKRKISLTKKGLNNTQS